MKVNKNNSQLLKENQQMQEELQIHQKYLLNLLLKDGDLKEQEKELMKLYSRESYIPVSNIEIKGNIKDIYSKYLNLNQERQNIFIKHLSGKDKNIFLKEIEDFKKSYLNEESTIEDYIYSKNNKAKPPLYKEITKEDINEIHSNAIALSKNKINNISAKKDILNSFKINKTPLLSLVFASPLLYLSSTLFSFESESAFILVGLSLLSLYIAIYSSISIIFSNLKNARRNKLYYRNFIEQNKNLIE